MKLFSVIFVVAAFAGFSDAFWRMVCKGRAGLARIDPMVSPGEVAQHVHSIHGSSGKMSPIHFVNLLLFVP